MKISPSEYYLEHCKIIFNGFVRSSMYAAGAFVCKEKIRLLAKSIFSTALATQGFTPIFIYGLLVVTGVKFLYECMKSIVSHTLFESMQLFQDYNLDREINSRSWIYFNQ